MDLACSPYPNAMGDRKMVTQQQRQQTLVEKISSWDPRLFSLLRYLKAGILGVRVCVQILARPLPTSDLGQNTLTAQCLSFLIRVSVRIKWTCFHRELRRRLGTSGPKCWESRGRPRPHKPRVGLLLAVAVRCHPHCQESPPSLPLEGHVLPFSTPSSERPPHVLLRRPRGPGLAGSLPPPASVHSACVYNAFTGGAYGGAPWAGTREAIPVPTLKLQEESRGVGPSTEPDGAHRVGREGRRTRAGRGLRALGFT